LLCARIAAELVAKCHRAGSYRAEDLSEYERGWKKAIQREILVGYYARKIYARLNDDQIIRLFELAQTNGIIPLIQEKGHFDWQSEVILALIKKTPVFSILKGISKKPRALEKTIA
jgi:flavin-dependent dehydrogenase